MGKILDILHKLNRHSDSSEVSKHSKITPNETELASYKRQEYLDNVKHELARYRTKNSMLAPSKEFNFNKKEPSLLKSNKKMKFKKIMNQENLFW